MPIEAGNTINTSESNKLAIGVLALQGCVQPHKQHIEAAGGRFVAVKTAGQLENVDGLILPGGESTTMLKLIGRFEMTEPLQKFFASKPVWGICAGAILMATEVSNPAQESFGLIPMSVQRNGYGRQLDSTHQNIDGYSVSFIRAPVFDSVSKDVEIVASVDENPVWVRYKHYTAMAFHPELTLDFPSPMHQTFIQSVKAFSAQKQDAA